MEQPLRLLQLRQPQHPSQAAVIIDVASDEEEKKVDVEEEHKVIVIEALP